METRTTSNLDDKLKEQKRDSKEDLINPLTKKVEHVETIIVDLATSVKALSQQPAMPNNAPSGYNRHPLAITYTRGAAPSTRGYMGGGNDGRGGYPKRLLVCMNCRKEGHPTRLCTELR